MDANVQVGDLARWFGQEGITSRLNACWPSPRWLRVSLTAEDRGVTVGREGRGGPRGLARRHNELQG